MTTSSWDLRRNDKRSLPANDGPGRQRRRRRPARCRLHGRRSVGHGVRPPVCAGWGPWHHADDPADAVHCDLRLPPPDGQGQYRRALACPAHDDARLGTHLRDQLGCLSERGLEPSGGNARLPRRRPDRHARIGHRYLRPENRRGLHRHPGSERQQHRFLRILAARVDVAGRDAVHARHGRPSGHDQDRTWHPCRNRSGIRGAGAIQRHAGAVRRLAQGIGNVRPGAAVRGAGRIHHA